MECRLTYSLQNHYMMIEASYIEIKLDKVMDI